MPHLTFLMKRPKEFKKEFTVENPPDFLKISKNNPLPSMHSQAQKQSVIEHDILTTRGILDSSPTLESLSIQHSSLLLTYYQNEMCLRQLRLKRQLLLSSSLLAIEIRNRNLTGQSVVTNFTNML